VRGHHPPFFKWKERKGAEEKEGTEKGKEFLI
jgi:hypothetical protein